MIPKFTQLAMRNLRNMPEFAGVSGETAEQVQQLVEKSGEELDKALNNKSLDFFIALKDLKDYIAKEFYQSFKKRWNGGEERVKKIEKLLQNLKFDDMSMEEGRFEILGELLDKACQGFDVFDEHENRRIPYGHRMVLEARLLKMIHDSFDLIQSICDEFDKLRGKKDEIDNERDMLRLEIRLCDMYLTDIHEKFLKSYLEMDW